MELVIVFVAALIAIFITTALVEQHSVFYGNRFIFDGTSHGIELLDSADVKIVYYSNRVSEESE